MRDNLGYNRFQPVSWAMLRGKRVRAGEKMMTYMRKCVVIPWDGQIYSHGHTGVVNAEVDACHTVESEVKCVR